MKVILSKLEMSNIVCKALGFPAETEIVVEENSVSDNLRSLIRSVSQMKYRGEDKVKAIKEVRSVFNCSLFEGKWIVENWESFRTFVEVNHRVPQLRGSYQNYQMV